MNRRDLLVSLAGTGGALATASTASGDSTDEANAPQDAEFHQGYIECELGQIYFWTAGLGPNVTFIHQSGNSSQEYKALLPMLASRCRLIALDLPGHGRSDDPTTEPTVDDYAAAVTRVLDHLKVERTHMVGHHGGALTTMNFAAQHPRRIAKTVLSGVGGLKTAEESQKFVASILNVDTTIRTETGFIADAWERYVAMMSDGATAADILRPFLAFLDARLRPFRGVLVNLKWDRRPALSKLRGPTLLVQGSLDRFVSQQESLLDVIPNSARIELQGCGTFMFYDKPAVCASMLIDYLDL